MALARPIANRATRALLVLSVIGLSACSSSTASVEPSVAATTPASPSLAAVEPSASLAASAAPSTPEASSPAESAGPTAVPTAIDPCALVTPDEVSKLLGTTVSPGSGSTQNNDKTCSYGQGGLGFQVLVAVAPDAATAKAQEPAFKTSLEQLVKKAGITDAKLTELPDFQPGVDAAVLSGSLSAAGQKISAISLYALKGAVLVAMSDVALGGSVPTSAAMQDEAKIVLGRLP